MIQKIFRSTIPVYRSGPDGCYEFEMLPMRKQDRSTKRSADANLFRLAILKSENTHNRVYTRQQEPMRASS
jgi:hypothetical protein